MRIHIFGIILSLSIGGNLHSQKAPEPGARLMSAIAAGDLGEVKAAFAEDASNLNKSFPESGTPLMYAAERHFPAAIEFLLKQGADVNGTDGQGKTALMVCGLDMFHIRSSGGGRTAPGLKEEMKKEGPKALAKRQGVVKKVVELLLKKGADINRADKDGMTALHYAIRRDDLLVVKILLKAGAKVDARNKEGHSPLALMGQGYGAPSKDTDEIRRLLKEAGAKE